MDKQEGRTPVPQSDILDKAEDFGPAKVASGQVPTPEIDEVAAAKAEQAASERDPNHLVPKMNLLGEPEPGAVKHPATAQEPVKLRPHTRKVSVVVLGLVAVALGAGGAAAYDSMTPGPIIARATPTPVMTPMPTATLSPAPSATPTSSPTPTPTPAQAPAEVTAPAVTPTKENPQAVTVTSKSGIWLRSSPSSANRKNIIGWIPNGATVSVDEVGDFWWHGTYKGETGYFAVKYTK